MDIFGRSIRTVVMLQLLAWAEVERYRSRHCCRWYVDYVSAPLRDRSISIPVLQTQSASGIFMAKYGNSASPVWVQSFGGSGPPTLMLPSYVYLSGTFSGSVDLDGGPGSVSFTVTS